MKQSVFTNPDLPTQAEIDQYLDVAQQLRSRELRRQLGKLFNAPRKLLGKSSAQKVNENDQEESKSAAA